MHNLEFDEGLTNESMRAFFKMMVKGDVFLFYTDHFNDEEKVKKALQRFYEDHNLFVRKFKGRDAITSGYDWKRTRAALEKESIFKEFLDKVETKFKVRTGWFSQYFGDGIFNLLQRLGVARKK